MIELVVSNVSLFVYRERGIGREEEGEKREKERRESGLSQITREFELRS